MILTFFFYFFFADGGVVDFIFFFSSFSSFLKGGDDGVTATIKLIAKIEEKMTMLMEALDAGTCSLKMNLFFWSSTTLFMYLHTVNFVYL